jgi:hypothetical protein
VAATSTRLSAAAAEGGHKTGDGAMTRAFKPGDGASTKWDKKVNVSNGQRGLMEFKGPLPRRQC